MSPFLRNKTRNWTKGLLGKNAHWADFGSPAPWNKPGMVTCNASSNCDRHNQVTVSSRAVGESLQGVSQAEARTQWAEHWPSIHKGLDSPSAKTRLCRAHLPSRHWGPAQGDEASKAILDKSDGGPACVT